MTPKLDDLQGNNRLLAIVGICVASHLFLSLVFTGAGFGGIWAFYAVPSVVFFLFFVAFAVKTIAKPADTKWLYGQPEYWFAILLGALLTGCALGFHWPTVARFQSTTKIATVSELQGEPESIEFINGVTAIIPAVSNTTINMLGVYQQEYEERNTGSGNIPEKCYLAVGLGDLQALGPPPAGFSMTVGCSALGRCTDVSVVSSCLEKLRLDCNPCNPLGAVPVAKLPWIMKMSETFPEEATEDFRNKNSISVRGFTHVEFIDFADNIQKSESIMIGCGVAGLLLTVGLSAFRAARARAKVDGFTTRADLEQQGQSSQIEVTKVEMD